MSPKINITSMERLTGLEKPAQQNLKQVSLSEAKPPIVQLPIIFHMQKELDTLKPPSTQTYTRKKNLLLMVKFDSWL